MKLLQKEPSGGIETPDGVKSRRRVNANHQNVEYFIVMTTPLSLIQCLVTALFDVRFKPSQRVEVGIARSTAVSGIAPNSYKLGVGNVNVAREKHCGAVRRHVIIGPLHLDYHISIVKFTPQ